MTTINRHNTVREYGDFQTPDALAQSVTQIVKETGFLPGSIVEPTCGIGAFVLAAVSAFPSAENLLGIEINNDHLGVLRNRLDSIQTSMSIELVNADFFNLDWNSILQPLAEPILFLGNPPWVTSSELGVVGSSNLPQKSNFQRYTGLDALTGKSNFDISESMLLKFLELLRDRKGAIAMLCKTAVARKILAHSWRKGYPIKNARIYRIDAPAHFGAAVDACLFLAFSGSGIDAPTCPIFKQFTDMVPFRTIGYQDGVILSDAEAYNAQRFLHGKDATYTWRSGIKHDCARVMELQMNAGILRNKSGDHVGVEDTYVYPMLKSSDVNKGDIKKSMRYMLVTQTSIGEDTHKISTNAPLTWSYLLRHADAMAKRASSIYKDQPPFSIFGVGEYSFTPWKVAISGFYKSLGFAVVGPVRDKPVVFDDTVYFLPCHTEEEAKFLGELLNSDISRRFLDSMIFWDDKRPITIDVLKRLHIEVLASELDREREYCSHVSKRVSYQSESQNQMSLFSQ